MSDYFEEQNLVNLNKILCDEQEKGVAMTNREKFKEEILDIIVNGENLAVDKRTLEPCACSRIECRNCIVEEANCRKTIKEWVNSEYVEPCEFKPGELVEVSYDGICWALRYFSYKAHDLFYTTNIKNRKENYDYFPYCQKYGTLGDLVKEQKNE